MDRSGLTTIGRAIDVRYPAHRAIIVLAGILAVGRAIAGLASAKGVGPSLLEGIALGGAAFLAWALGRELDPDHPGSAFPAALLTSAAGWLIGPPDLLVLFWALIGLRILNRSTGLPAGPLDTLGFAGLSVGVGLRLGWPMLVVAASVLLADGLLQPGCPRHKAVGVVALAGAIGATLSGAFPAAWAVPKGPVLAAVLSVTAAFGLLAFNSRQLTSVADRTSSPLQVVRVRTAQLAAVVAGLVLTFSGGPAGLALAAPLWAVAASSVLYRGTLRLVRFR